MKKTISFILITCLFTGLFSGCIFNKVSLEEDIINMQLGGYLYTSQVRADTKDERDVQKARKKTIDSMVDYMEKTARNSFNLSDGLSKYEDNLVKYIKKVETDKTDNTTLLFTILEKIAAYKVILESYEDEINSYMKMKPENQATQAIIRTYEFSTICNLFNVQNEYVSWLINNTASVASLLENTNKRQSDNLLSSSATIYGKQIEKLLSDIYEDYEKAAYLNSIIVSADYYTSLLYINEADENIKEIKSDKINSTVSSDKILDLTNMYSDAVDSLKKPSLLVPIPDEKNSLSLMKKVSAADNEKYAYNNIISLYALSSLASTKQELPNSHTYIIPTSNDMAEELNEQKSEIQKTPEIIFEKVTEKPQKIVEDSKETGLFASMTDKAASALSGLIKIGTAFVENKIEGIVEKAQEYIKNNHNDINSQYAAIIDKLTEYIIKGKEDSKQVQTIKNLIENDLEDMLRGNKEQFVNYILNSNADKLIKTFEEWKKNLSEGEKHEYTKMDLINLLIAMGIDIKEEIVKTESKPTPASTQIPVSTMTQNPVHDSSATPVPSAPAYIPVSPEDWTPGYEALEIFDVFHINATHFLFKEIDIFSDNESLLFLIYGWVDPLNYSNYQKIETTKMDGSLLDLFYLDNSENRVGWALRLGENSVLTYTYHFSGEENKTLKIMRTGNLEKSYVQSINSEDKSIDRKSSIGFNKPDDEGVFETVHIIFEEQNGNKDGLNFSGSSFNYTYEYRKNGNLIDSFQYNYGILIAETHNTFSDDDKYSNKKSYFDSGLLMADYNTLNNSPEGIQKTYYENKFLQSITEFKNGEKNGIEKRYYESGRLSVLETYVNGEKNGHYEKYYDNDNHQLHMKGTYTKNKQSDIWLIYNEDGSLQEQINY